MAILRHKAEEEGARISPQIINYIAREVRDNVRELVGCLTRVIAYSSMTGKEVTLEEAKDILRDLIKSSSKLTVDQIIEIVANSFNVRELDIRGTSRKSEVLIARQVAIYLARVILGLSLKKIGYHFGKDHSTVIHTIRKMENLLKTNSDFVQKVEEIRSLIVAHQI